MTPPPQLVKRWYYINDIIAPSRLVNVAKALKHSKRGTLAIQKCLFVDQNNRISIEKANWHCYIKIDEKYSEKKFFYSSKFEQKFLFEQKKFSSSSKNFCSNKKFFCSSKNFFFKIFLINAIFNIIIQFKKSFG